MVRIISTEQEWEDEEVDATIRILARASRPGHPEDSTQTAPAGSTKTDENQHEELAANQPEDLLPGPMATEETGIPDAQDGLASRLDAAANLNTQSNMEQEPCELS